MTLLEMSKDYETAAAALRSRLKLLRQKLRETDDPEDYVRQLLKGRAVSVSAQQESGGAVTVYADCDGLIQKFIFTPV